MDKYFENDYISIFTQQDEDLLWYTITGYPRFSEVIWKGHDKIYEMVLEKKISKPILNIIADLRSAKILLEPDIEFIARVSYRRLAKEGVKNLVILVPEDVHVRINVEKTIEYLGPEVFSHVAVLSEFDEALQWFRKLK